MSSNFKAIAALGFAFVLSTICTSPVIGQEAPETVKQLPAVFQYNGDMANLLAQLPSVYGRTIGLEVDPRQPRSTVGFHLKNPTLADVLNAITKSSPNYRWTERDEFIEVVPLTGTSPLLDTRISDFSVDYADGAEAITQLLNLPEAHASMSALRLRYRDPVNASAIGRGKKLTFTVHDVTVRQVLNKIANDNGSRFWALQRNSAGFFSISISPN